MFDESNTRHPYPPTHTSPKTLVAQFRSFVESKPWPPPIAILIRYPRLWPIQCVRVSNAPPHHLSFSYSTIHHFLSVSIKHIRHSSGCCAIANEGEFIVFFFGIAVGTKSTSFHCTTTCTGTFFPHGSVSERTRESERGRGNDRASRAREPLLKKSGV